MAPPVGVSLLPVKRDMIGGLASYVRHVAPALAQGAPARYVFFAPSGLADYWKGILPPGARLEALEIDNSSATARSLFEIFRLPKLAARLGCPVLFYPNTTAPISARARQVVALFDVMYRSQPHDSPIHKRLYLDWCCHRLRQSDVRVVTLSEFSREDIARRTRIPREQIVAIPCGVDDIFFAPQVPSGVSAALNDRPYLLSVAAAYPHKRLPLLVDAFELVARDHPHFRLVLAGTTHGSRHERSRLLQRIALSPSHERIMVLPEQPWETLPALYRGAAIVVHSSQFEGFGFPIAEALASGTAVAAAPAGAVVELLQGLGEVATGWSAGDLADAIRRVLAWSPVRRADVAAKGRALMRDSYRWKHVAAALEREFQAMLHRAPGQQHVGA